MTSTTTKCLAAALKLLDLGYWPIAIYPPGVKLGDRTTKGKEPIGKSWGSERWDRERLEKTFERYPEAGIGICFGPGRAPGGGWLIDLEGDGDGAAESLARLLGGEVPDTPSWSSRRGNHHIFDADGERLLRALAAAGAKEERGIKAGVWKLPELPGLEIRVGGFVGDRVKQVQSVVPPTKGEDGQPRGWTHQPRASGGVAPLPESAYAFLERLAASRKPAASGPRSNGHASHAGGNVVIRAIKYLDTIEPAISGQRGHDKTFGAACRVGPGFDLPPDVTFRLLMEHYNPRCEPPWTEADIRHKVEDAYREETRRGWLLRSGRSRSGSTPPPSTNGNGQHRPEEDRPQIEVTTERHQVVEAAIQALARDPELYRRGDTLGIVIVEEEITAKLPAGVVLTNAKGSARFMPLSDANVSCFLTRNAQFHRWKSDPNGEDIAVDIHPPDWLTKAVATRGHWPGVRPLVLIAECPYVRPDGSIPRPGYDRTTGTLYRPSIELTGIPERPTKEQAREAVDRLYEVVAQFPFAELFDFAVWLAGLLTAIQRPIIEGPVPGFVFNGNKAGIGKGLLIDAIGLVSWGHGIPTRTYPTDPAEAAKTKLSIALAGVSAVHFDNLPEGGFFGNSELDSALTSTEVGGRILGQSRESGAVPLRPCWYLSGNNISPARDAFRRWLSCNLRTALEAPHERADIEKPNLRRYVLEHRAELLRAALVILRAHAAADQHGHGMPPLGSFEEWDQAVRGPVYFATGLDCLVTQRKAAAESPERVEKLALLEGWQSLPNGGVGERGLTVVEAIDAVLKSPGAYPVLEGAFRRMSRDEKLAGPKQVANRIRAMNGQNVGGLRFERAGTENHTGLWRVARA
jgi:hypothetical protein